MGYTFTIKVKELSSEELLEKLLELRRKIKSAKPEFHRYLWWKKPAFKNDLKWRKPKGIDNKARLKLKGYPPLVEVGYRAPRAVRGLHPTGLKPVVVHSLSELEGLDPLKHIVYVASTTGLRNKLKIVEEAEKRGFKVANPVAR